MSRWMDNKFVIIVSTVHKIVDTVVSGIRRPRVTLLNKGHVDEVWGTQGKLLFFLRCFLLTNIEKEKLTSQFPGSLMTITCGWEVWTKLVSS